MSKGVTLHTISSISKHAVAGGKLSQFFNASVSLMGLQLNSATQVAEGPQCRCPMADVNPALLDRFLEGQLAPPCTARHSISAALHKKVYNNSHKQQLYRHRRPERSLIIAAKIH